MQSKIKIVQIDVNSLKPAEYNPRKWTEKTISDLTKSIKEFGLIDPIIANSAKERFNMVIGGHFRLKIAKDLGYTTVPVVYVNIPVIKKEMELNARLNKNTGEWDYELLANFDEDILKDIGFGSDELDKIFKPDTSPTDDELPEVQKTNIKRGDIFKLGSHRLLCGDSTDTNAVAVLMQNDRADLIFSDPPYGVNYGHDQKELQKRSGGKYSKTRKYSKIENDELKSGIISEKVWKPAFKNYFDFAKDDCSFYITMPQGGGQMMMMMMMSKHWQVKHEIIWVKNAPVFSMGRLDYDYRHEPIMFGWKNKHNWYGGGQFKNSVWEIVKPTRSDLHPTMKPIELIENAILNSSKRDDLVIDFFGGSGSTLIACEKTNRKCIMIEIDPIYCQAIIDRWEKFVGKKALKSV